MFTLEIKLSVGKCYCSTVVQLMVLPIPCIVHVRIEDCLCAYNVLIHMSVVNFFGRKARNNLNVTHFTWKLEKGILIRGFKDLVPFLVF